MKIEDKGGKKMYSEDIVEEIGSTLDKLIENAKAIKNVNLTKEEVIAFQKTQESLLAHLVSLDELLQIKRKMLNLPKKNQLQIRSKINAFENLNANFIKKSSEKLKFIKLRKIRKKSKINQQINN